MNDTIIFKLNTFITPDCSIAFLDRLELKGHLISVSSIFLISPGPAFKFFWITSENTVVQNYKFNCDARMLAAALICMR